MISYATRTNLFLHIHLALDVLSGMCALVGLELEVHAAQRRHAQLNGIGLILAGEVFGALGGAHVALTGTSELHRVGVEHLGDQSRLRDAHAVIAVECRGEVEDAQKLVARVIRTDEGENRTVGIVGITPSKAVPGLLNAIQGGVVFIEIVL